MAELASGAVSSLLGVIRNEWQLLGRVGGDVQFIREEMESMNSFLMHLTRTVPPGGEHDEQVRTWMNQVRLLAQDCNNCIDLYLYRGNPDIHLGKDCLGRYLKFVPWFVRKMVAQHHAALELRELKERARDVGKRRLRYGVEVPKNAATEGGGHHDQVAGTITAASPSTTDGSVRIRRALFGLYTPEDYFHDKLGEWIKEVEGHWAEEDSARCVAVVVPSTDNSGAIASQASTVVGRRFDNTVVVDIPWLHYWSALGPKNVLYYILREIQLQRNNPSSSKGQGEEEVVDWCRQMRIREEKREAIGKIKKDMQTMKVADKIQEIKTQIQKVNHEQLQPSPEKTKTGGRPEQKEASLGVLLVQLHWSSIAAATDEMKKKDMPTLAESYGNLIKNTAKNLKDYMEPVNQGGRKNRILQHVTQYEHILREVFPEVGSHSKRQQAQGQEQDTKRATTSESEATPAGKDQIREIIDKVGILSDVLKEINDNLRQQATKNNSTSSLNEHQVKKMIHEAKLEILQQLKQEDRSDKKQEAGVPGGQGPPTPTPEALSEEESEKKGQLDTTASNKAIQKPHVEEALEKNTETLDAIIKETTYKVQYYIKRRIERQLVINGIVDEIEKHLQSKNTLQVILKVGKKYVSQWEQTRNALSLLPSAAAVMMILTKTETNQIRAKQEYCYPQGREPIDYSLSAIYHDIVLEITSQQKNEDNYDPHQDFGSILDKCESNKFCMKMFAHTLYAKPKRSKEELHKLHNALQELPPKSFHRTAMKMLKFSYRDLTKEYKSCLLYLAIFPPGHQIRRSTLIGRWVAEGLITTEDWRWSTSVHKAEQCFDALINKWLIYPAEISATGRVKSCTVGDLVHEFITEIAKKQRIVETRLSHHLARHFSIFNDLHLRRSDKIFTFLRRVSEPSSQWSRLKVLDLEGCQCFKKNPHYLKNICKNVLLLKYLSLRGTDVNRLPHNINNLRELEVLDIQQTEVPESGTKNLLILKLKRLLAGQTTPGPSTTDDDDDDTGTPFQSHVVIPEKVEKMLDMEVLSNVKVQKSHDLKDIGQLWQLRKLGVVIQNKPSHYMMLLEAISNLHECLRSLSVTFDVTNNGPPVLLGVINTNEQHSPPKVLESLSISGITEGVDLSTLLLFSKDTSPLTKVTLSNSSLSQDILQHLSSLPMLRYLRLMNNKYNENKLTFKDGFKELKCLVLVISNSNRVEISYEGTAASKLERIVLSFNNIESIAIAGVDRLSELEELELLNKNKKTSPVNPAAPFNTSAAPDTDAAVSASFPIAATGTDHVPSTPAASSTTNPSPFAPTATAVANEPVPSTTTAATSPTLSAPTATSTGTGTGTGTNDSVPSNTIATDPGPSAPTGTTTIPSPSATTTFNKNNTLISMLSDAKQLSKLTLRGTMLKQDDLRILARMANIRYLVLFKVSYGETELALSNNEFPELSILVVNSSTITRLKFEKGSSPKLEKIVWTFTKMDSFLGIENLPRLNELEFKGDSLPDKVKDDLKDRIYYTYYKLENQDQTTEEKKDKDGVPSCPFIWKDRGLRWRS
ncbi:hypothetical protein U9M48_039025 [Paspalum notatum var. saurae]|uniref:Rx N-terminal domain-containing protein n=1 Tax=Paspalum notatum var. saurae TaxID=547442 RepID=A0AAQ3UN23_PASNO